MGDLAQNLGLGGHTTAQTAQPVPGQPDDITVQGDGWNPKKPTLLGILADGYLISKGMQPGFAINRDKRNVEEALDGFTQDPLQSINRLARIRGHQDDAIKLYNQYQDNSRLDRAESRLDSAYHDKARGVMASMLGAATPENYGSMRQRMLTYGKSRGLTDDELSDLPEKYDPDAIAAWRYGAVPVDAQMDNSRDAVAKGALIDYRNKRLGQFDRTYGEQVRHNLVSEGIAAKKEERIAAGKPGGRGIFDKSTGKRVGEYDKTGQYVRIYRDGQVQVFDVTGGLDNAIRRPDLDPKPAAE